MNEYCKKMTGDGLLLRHCDERDIVIITRSKRAIGVMDENAPYSSRPIQIQLTNIRGDLRLLRGNQKLSRDY